MKTSKSNQAASVDDHLATCIMQSDPELFLKCVICTEIIDGERRMALMPCMHQSCEFCVFKLVKQRSGCPFCRRRFSANSVKIMLPSFTMGVREKQDKPTPANAQIEARAKRSPSNEDISIVYDSISSRKQRKAAEKNGDGKQPTEALVLDELTATQTENGLSIGKRARLELQTTAVHQENPPPLQTTAVVSPMPREEEERQSVNGFLDSSADITNAVLVTEIDDNVSKLYLKQKAPCEQGMHPTTCILLRVINRFACKERDSLPLGHRSNDWAGSKNNIAFRQKMLPHLHRHYPEYYPPPTKTDPEGFSLRKLKWRIDELRKDKNIQPKYRQITNSEARDCAFQGKWLSDYRTADDAPKTELANLVDVLMESRVLHEKNLQLSGHGERVAYTNRKLKDTIEFHKRLQKTKGPLLRTTLSYAAVNGLTDTATLQHLLNAPGADGTSLPSIEKEILENEEQLQIHLKNVRGVEEGLAWLRKNKLALPADPVVHEVLHAELIHTTTSSADVHPLFNAKNDVPIKVEPLPMDETKYAGLCYTTDGDDKDVIVMDENGGRWEEHGQQDWKPTMISKGQ